MVIFSQLEKKGNLGNQLFQIASTVGLAKKNNLEFGFPSWKFANFFENELPKIPKKRYEFLKEKHFHYHEWDLSSNIDYDLDGWLQSEKYFNKSITNHYFKFKDSLILEVREKNKVLFEKKTILISIRRGDFVGHKDYFQLPILYYILALNIEFPDWRNANLLIASDDINYCKIHFSFLENAFFAENLSAIEQLCLGSLCDDFIISNSTFSWWIAYLGEKNHSKVVRPLHYFDNQKAIDCADKDYFPGRWTVFNHLDKKIDLKEVTFIIENSNQKLINSKNKLLNIELLEQNFNTNLVYDSQIIKSYEMFDYQYLNHKITLKIKELNEAFLLSSVEKAVTNLIVILDSDTLMSPLFILESVNYFLKSKDQILKHEFHASQVDRKPYFKKIRKIMDIGILSNSKSRKDVLKDVLIFDKTKINYKKEVYNLKLIENEIISFSFSHKPMLYFGFKEKMLWFKFQLFVINKFCIKPFFKN